MANERDTHFAGFARALMQEVDEKNRAKAQSTGRYLDEEELHLLIAQRAYDLVFHDHQHIEHIDLDRLTLEEQVAKIPDLTEWTNDSAPEQ